MKNICRTCKHAVDDHREDGLCEACQRREKTCDPPQWVTIRIHSPNGEMQVKCLEDGTIGMLINILAESLGYGPRFKFSLIDVDECVVISGASKLGPFAGQRLLLAMESP